MVKSGRGSQTITVNRLQMFRKVEGTSTTENETDDRKVTHIELQYPY